MKAKRWRGVLLPLGNAPNEGKGDKAKAEVDFAQAKKLNYKGQ